MTDDDHRTIIQLGVATWSRSYWSAIPGGEIIVPGSGLITEVRCTLDPEDEAQSIQKAARLRLKRREDHGIEFVADPHVRYGYRLCDKDGGHHIVGDASLFYEDMTEAYENERVSELARRIGLMSHILQRDL